jgi:hypothetical protein
VFDSNEDENHLILGWIFWIFDLLLV